MSDMFTGDVFSWRPASANPCIWPRITTGGRTGGGGGSGIARRCRGACPGYGGGTKGLKGGGNTGFTCKAGPGANGMRNA